MRIIELLDPNCIIPEMTATTKRQALEELAHTLARETKGLEAHKVVEVLMERERLGTTGIGDHVAIPHGKLANLSEIKLAFGRSRKGVDFEALDGKLTHLFFLLLAPINSAGLHLKALAKISRILMSAGMREKLLEAADREEIYHLLAKKDEELSQLSLP